MVKTLRSGTITFTHDKIPSVTGGKSPAMDFADAILHGNPEAHRLVAEATGDLPWEPKKEPEPSLADEFIAATYKEPQNFHGKTRKLFSDVMMRYRIDMRKAHRFVLDDQFVELATEMAAADAAKVLARLQYATLPYDQTWIEFNLHAKMRAIHRLNGTEFKNQHEVSPRLGCLLQRINDTDAVCTLVSPMEDRVMPHMTCYFFSIVETSFEGRNRPDNYFGCVPMTMAPHEQASIISPVGPEEFRRDSSVDSVGKASLWGYIKGAGFNGIAVNPRAVEMVTPEFLLRHGDIGLSRAFPPYTTFLHDQKAISQATEMILAETREFTGTIRWLVTVLAMLNEVPVHADLVVREHQMKVGHFKKHKFVDYHKVTLRLPKTKPIPFIERHLRGQSERRHRAHTVRSFWRTYLHEQHCAPDEHDWTYDHDDGYRLCGRCMAYSRLIHEHVRGNAELGWVRKDYVIRPQVKHGS